VEPLQRFSLLALLVALGCFGAPSKATDYYVKKGSGCTRSYPSCGVDEPGREFDDVDLCSRVLAPGDTCWIKNGIYSNGASTKGRHTYVPRNSGRPDAPLTFRAYPDHRPVFRDGGNWDLGISGQKHHVVYSGLVIEGVLRVQGSSESERVRGVRIEHCEISGGGGKSDGNWAGIFAQWTEDLVIANNVIRDARVDEGLGGSDSAKGITLFNGRRTLIEHNYLHGHPSEGIFDKEGGEDNVIRRNVFESNGKHVKVNNQADERKLYNERTQIYENLFLCDRGGGSTSILMLSRPTAWSVYNNTGFECSGIEVRSSSGPANAAAVYNNIWWRSEEGKAMWSSQEGDDREPDYMDHNLYAPRGKYRENRYSDSARSVYGLEQWRGREHPKVYDTHSLEADPRFLDPGNRDFRLHEESPARGAGRGGEDLGAYPRADDTVIGPTGGGVPASLPAVEGGPPLAPAFRSSARDRVDASDANNEVCLQTLPETIFCEDFESGRIERRQWRDVNLGGKPESPALTVQDEFVAGGHHAAMGRAVAGRSTDLWAARGFGDHPLWGVGEPVTDIEIRAKLRWSEGFDFEKGGAKIFIVGAFEDWSAGYIGPNPWSPYYLLLQWRRTGKSDRPQELEGVLHRKTECAEVAGAKGCNRWRSMKPNLASLPLRAGRWYDVRYRVALNTPGLQDGLFEAWVDGVKIIEYRDVDYRGRYTSHGLNQFMLSRRANKKSPTQSLFWDELLVSATAPLSASSAPPASGAQKAP